MLKCLFFPQFNCRLSVFSSLFGVILLLGALLFSGALTVQAETPTLPALYRGKKPVILSFYATWCSACKQMKPFETSLQKNLGNRITWTPIDMDTAIGQGLAQRFGINSTPSYLLFTQPGKLQFVLTGKVSPSMLKLQSYKLAGLTEMHPLPETLKKQAIYKQLPEKGKSPRFTLVRFVADKCQRTACKKDSEKYIFFQKQLVHWPAPMDFYVLDATQAKSYLTQLQTSAMPYTDEEGLYYTLLDAEGMPLVRRSGPLTPSLMRDMGAAIQMAMIGARH